MMIKKNGDFPVVKQHLNVTQFLSLLLNLQHINSRFIQTMDNVKSKFRHKKSAFSRVIYSFQE